jgi:hypothetical protein
MAKTIKFVLRERWDAPDNLGFDTSLAKDETIPNSKYSRHHIVGRKFMTMLMELLTTFEFVTIQDRSVRPQDWNVQACDDRIKKFAEYTGNAYNALFAAFFWSPWNLFIGPARDYRTFDPGSGVEPVKPKNFSATRWAAVKAIPEVMDKMGVPLAKIAALDNNGEITFTLKVDDSEGKKSLEELLEGFSKMRGKQTGKPYRFDPDEWAVVNTSKDARKVLEVTNNEKAVLQYKMAGEAKLIEAEKTWSEVANQPAANIKLKMVLIT